jgi:FkbM family methyltransferase
MRGGYAMALCPNADRFERRLYDARTYEPATLALFDGVLRPGDIAVDVGANLGLMTLHAAYLVGATGSVVAVEPHPVYFSRLIRNIELNNLTNVRAVQMAAGAAPELRTIYDVPSVNIGRSSLVRPNIASRPGGVVSVERLDKILSDLGIPRVRLIKIDVEGFEPKVIQGASEMLAGQPMVCMEVTSALNHEPEGPLAAHDMIMSTGLYDSFRFARGKGTVSALIKTTDREILATLEHDNVVYVPKTMQESLPKKMFF